MANETMSDNDNPELDGPAPTPSEMDAPVASDSEDKVAAFVPMSFFGGKTVKEGDTETVRVLSVDPETNEVQVECVYGGEKDRGKSMVDMMDEEIPEEA